MSYVTRTLTALPFGHIIGAPMRAAIEAQALAARATLEFIQAVGFKKQDTDDQLFPPIPAGNSIPDAAFDEVRNITFKYTQQNANGENQGVTLTVPLLTILPIPWLAIREMTIDFTAKLTEEYMNDNQATNNFDLTTSAAVGYKAFWSPVTANFNATASYKHSSTSQSTSRYSSEATMNINVRAGQDDVPAGLAKILSILEASILSTQTQPGDA